MRLRRLLAVAISCFSLLNVAAGAEPTLALELGGGQRLDLVRIAKGKFRQGSLADEKGRADNEAARDVTLSQDFYLSKYPVTRGQFGRFVKATGYRTEAERGPSGGFGLENGKLVQHKQYTWRNPGFEQTDEHPVVLVTFGDAQAFVTWLTKMTGQPCELPTEAQWEFACRAGSATPYCSGASEADLAGVGWYKANAGTGTRPVGGKKANAFGLFDMHGNVRQWCRDWYGTYEGGPVTDPEEKRNDRTKPARRVLRGGSFLTDARHCRAAARGRNTPGSRNADNGFRVLVAVKTGAVAPGLTPRGPIFAAVNFDGPELLFGLVCLAMMVGAVILLATRIYVHSKQSHVRFGKQDVGVRTAADGFWLDASQLRRGTIVRYQYLVAGAMRTGSYTTTTTGEEFIYTGEAPTGVRILQAAYPRRRQDDDDSGIDTTDNDDDVASFTSSSSSSSDDPSPPPSSGYPSAY